MLKLRSKIVVLLIIPLLCMHCSSFKADNVTVSIDRFEVDFYNTDTTDFEFSVQSLAMKYPNFYPIYVEGVLNITNDFEDYDDYLDDLYIFRSHPALLGLFDSVKYHYPQVDDIEIAIGKALTQYEIKMKEPADFEVVTFMSEFGNKAIIYDGGIGISLDMFLGKNFPFYPSMRIPSYISEHLTKEQILPNTIRVLAEDLVPPLPQDATLLDNMILEGKRLYFAEQILPNTPKENIIEYSKEQYKWCEDNEYNIWTSFIASELLYNAKFTEFRRYIEEGPSTLGMPQESPGKVGVFIGWQIVRKYMERNKNTSLKELLKMTDAQELLNNSKYKPD